MKIAVYNPCAPGYAVLDRGYLSPPWRDARVLSPWNGGPDVEVAKCEEIPDHFLKSWGIKRVEV